MMTIEIKVNDRIKEVIDVVQIEPEYHFDTRELSYDMEKEGWRVYLVNNTFKIQHRRQDGIRVLARLALNAIKKVKP